MVYQLNMQTITLTQRSRLIVRFPVAGTAARFWSITAAVRRPRIRTVCLSGSVTWSLALTTCRAGPVPDAGTQLESPARACRRHRHPDPRERGRQPVPLPVTDPETVKNRLHLDLTSSAQISGRPGQPGGNQFCVIRPKETLTPVRVAR